MWPDARIGVASGLYLCLCIFCVKQSQDVLARSFWHQLKAQYACSGGKCLGNLDVLNDTILYFRAKLRIRCDRSNMKLNLGCGDKQREGWTGGG